MDWRLTVPICIVRRGGWIKPAIIGWRRAQCGACFFCDLIIRSSVASQLTDERFGKAWVILPIEEVFQMIQRKPRLPRLPQNENRLVPSFECRRLARFLSFCMNKPTCRRRMARSSLTLGVVYFVGCLVSGVCLLSATSQVGAQESSGSESSLRPIVLGWERFQSDDEYAGDAPERELELLGNVLLSELSCTACHESESNAGLEPKRGPRLDGIGLRRDANWLREFLSEPSEAKPGTTMPDCLPEDDEVISALVALLTSSRQALFAEIPPSKDGDPAAASAQRGREWFGEKGCVACHPHPDETEASSRVPLRGLERRYSLVSLTQFLREPLVVLPHARMPDLQLDVLEAADLAAYLLGSSQENPILLSEEVKDERLMERGRREFVQRGCAACHTFESLRMESTALALDRLDVGRSVSCIGETSDTLPRWKLSDEQTQALRVAIENRKSTEPLPEHEQQRFRLDADLIRFNCTACHWRLDSQRYRWGGVPQEANSFFRNVGNYDLGDEGRLPPTLNRVGAKLNETWLRRAILGEARLRPFLAARMPRYPEAMADALASSFKTVDGPGIRELAEYEAPSETPGDVAVGLEVVNQSCVQCHPISGQSMVGVIGVDLAGLGERMDREWFDTHLRAPSVLRPGTRMPDFFPQGRSSLPGIARGNVERQIAGLWAYLSESQPEIPERITADQLVDFELHPNDRPILQRTFFEDVGTSALVVGFPSQVNLAFEMRRGELKQVWTGRFIDAHGTWFDRFAPPAKPLGERLPLPDGFARWSAIMNQAGADQANRREASGLGYELADDGSPWMLQQVDGFSIKTHWTAPVPAEGENETRGLHRLRIEGQWQADDSSSNDQLAWELGAGDFDATSRVLEFERMRIRIEQGEIVEVDGTSYLLPQTTPQGGAWSCELSW